MSRDNDLVKKTSEVLRRALSELETSAAEQSRDERLDRELQSEGQNQRSATDEFRKAFPGLCSRNVTRPNTSRQRSWTAPVGNPKKKKVTGYNALHFQPAETWTHDICILGRKDESTTPDRARSETLLRAGLGRLRVVFPNKNASHNELQKFLEDKFPKLKAGGGFEVLRAAGGGGGQRSLIPVLPTREGYTVPHLKETLSSAVGFFRPLQADLDESPTTEDECGPTVKCIHCNNDFSLMEVKKHVDDCSSKPKSQEKEEGIPVEMIVESDELFVNIEDNDAESSASHFSPQDNSLPGASRRPTQQENLEQLREMFPKKSSDELMQALRFHGNAHAAALSLSSTAPEAHEDVSSDDDSLLQPALLPSKSKTDSLQSLLEELGKNMSQEKVKVTIEEEDILNDALTYYKSPAFDAKKKLRIRFKGQPAVDTGGVTREFFTKLFLVICEMFFQGGKYKSPVYSADIVASGLMRYFGTMIVHSILQGGPGFPVFSPSVYCYIATGNVDAAMAKMNYGDCSEPIKHFIDKVAQAEDVANLDKEECSNMLSECGLAVALTNDNKMRVIQGVIIHDVIGRPKIILDQLADGLNTLGFRTAMKEYPALLEALFVPSSEKLNADSVIGVLQFPKDMDDNESTVAGFIHTFIKNAEVDTLEKFLFFATGAKVLPDFGLAKIQVKFDRVPSIFASTCLLEVTFPNQFDTQDSLRVSLQAVINTATGKSFNCV